MFRRGLISFSLLLLLIVTAACTNKKVQNPLADVGSKQPDKVLFDRAMDALKHNRYDVARITLQTLINTYPDSEYIARAKLAVGDSWYAEGGSAALTQAEIEYKDFITFFPNMPEAAEAQLKIANIHYAEMEKPDRDFTHAQRAEEEYRQLLLQFPDSKLVPQAKQRLLEVQEVLAEREYRIGRFYYMRQSYPAAIARLKSLVDRYPLYSQADDALFMLGSAYEGEIATVRRLPRITEVQKGKMIKEFTDGAADAYSRIITRYPVMNRANEAKKRLEALHRPVPTPTAAAVAQNKAEEESRLEPGHFDRIMANFRKKPDVAEAAHVGEPTLVDPKPVSATEVLRQATDALKPTSGAGGDSSVSGEIVKGGLPGPNQPVPRSDAPANGAAATSGAAPGSTSSAPASTSSAGPSAETGIEELKSMPDAGTPAVQPAQPPAQPAPQTPAQTAPSQPQAPAADASQASAADGSQPAAAPPQVNEAATAADSSSSPSTASDGSKQAASTASTDQSQNKDESSSKKKKKKGLGKLNPF